MKWKTKSNCRGKVSPAVTRQLSKCELNLESHESRSKFGYCYLEYVTDEPL